MEFQPKTETGKWLVAVLANWMKKSPESSVDKLKRLFLIHSLKVKYKDGFVAALYGQNILDETPSVLSWRFPSALLRVQYGMEIALNKRRAKELVVALERSESQKLLSEVFAWTQKHSDEIQLSIKRTSSVGPVTVKVLKIQEIPDSVGVVGDGAPVKVHKRKLASEVPTKVVIPRHGEISWTDDEKHCTALEVYMNMIIVGSNDGQTKIYDSTNLNCQKVLNYRRSEVTCFQCTGTEIIAGYENGVICVWNIQGEVVLQRLSVAWDCFGKHFLTCMRWRNPVLVVDVLNDCSGRDACVEMLIWRYVDSSFTLLHSWDSGERHVQDVDCNENYVILRPSGVPEPVHVHNFNGQRLRTLSTRLGIYHMVLHQNQLITCDRGGALQIWDICTGGCLKMLNGPAIRTFGFNAHNGVIAGGNLDEKVIVWSIKSVLEGGQVELPMFSPHNHKCITFDKARVIDIKVGANVLVVRSAECGHEKKIFVMGLFLKESTKGTCEGSSAILYA